LGWIVGFIGGIAEYYFLKAAAKALTSTQKSKAFVMMLLNMGCVFVTLALLVVFFRQQLLMGGLIMGGTLLALSVVSWALQSRKKDGD
jgi:hypothetical protein